MLMRVPCVKEREREREREREFSFLGGQATLKLRFGRKDEKVSVEQLFVSDLFR